MEIDTSPLPYIRKMKDIRGMQSGRLTVIAFSYMKGKRSYWRCICDCGNEIILRRSSIVTQNTQSCGCLSRDNFLKHGMSAMPEYKIWKTAKRRCFSPNDKNYSYYGGRGITVCDRWRDSFVNFISDMGQRPDGKYTLERIDNDGPYSPNNCCWATVTEQMNNKRSNHNITYRGVTQTIAEWSRELSIPSERIRGRVSLGMSLDKVFSKELLGNLGKHQDRMDSWIGDGI